MTDDTSEAAAKRIRAAHQFIAALPHCRALSMTVESVGEGEAAISMPWAADLVGDPLTGVIHGGAVSALMDTTGGAAVLSHPTAPIATATMDLRIDYMRSHAAPDDHGAGRLSSCHAVCRLRSGRSLRRRYRQGPSRSR